MTDTQQATPGLIDVQPEAIIGLLRDADTTELKISVPTRGRRADAQR